MDIPEEIDIKYKTFLNQENEELDNKSNLIERWQKLIILKEEEEINKGISILGPHRDNMKFLLNKRDVKAFASQGQIRTILLALLLAEIEFVYELLEEYPLVLLDELFSELDDKRVKSILTALPEDIQIFISETDPEKLKGKEGRWFSIEEGTVKRKN